MAGHSKWANIKHRKAAQDAQRGRGRPLPDRRSRHRPAPGHRGAVARARGRRRGGPVGR